jgi:hypothetical protein
VDLEKAGTVTAVTDFLELTNTTNRATGAGGMIGTGTSILWKQYYYDAVTPAAVDACRIAYVTKADWTSSASTQDGYLSTSLACDGVLTEMLRITSDVTSEAFSLRDKEPLWDSDNERASMGMVDGEYATIGRSSKTTGGLRLTGASDSTTGIHIVSKTTNESATVSATILNSYIADGAGGLTSLADTSQLLSTRNNNVTRFAIYGDGEIQQHDPGVAHGMTDLLPTTAYSSYGPCDEDHPNYGGLQIIGASDELGPAIRMLAIGKYSCSVHSYMDILVGAASGISYTDITDDHYALRVVNNTSQLWGIYGDGDIVIGNGAAGHDYSITVNGETSDGTLTWMEDEAEWRTHSGTCRIGTSIFATYTNGGGSYLGAYAFSDTAGHCGVVELVHYRGTEASSTATQSGDVLGAIRAWGFDTNGSLGAQIRFEATAEWGTAEDTSDSPAKIVFSTCANGSGSLVDRLSINSDGTNDLGAIVAGNYSRFEADGTLTFVGTATVWNDANMGSLSLRTGGTAPDVVQWTDNLGAATGIYGLGFAINEAGGSAIEIPHDYKEGTDLVFHVHWGVNAAPTGTDYVKWQLKYSVCRGGVTTPPATTITVETAIATQYDHKRSDFTAITGTNFKIGDQFIFEITRVAADGDAFSGDAIVETVGLHYECDTVGSRTIAAK